MTNDQCAQVVNLLVSSFPAGPKGHAWTDAINNLHPGPSMAAARELRDTVDRPTIAQFHAVYRRHLAAARADRQAERGTPPVCEQCDGSGWIEVTDDRRHARHCVDADACHCHAAEPCRCTAGNQARAVLPAIHEQNDRKP